MRKILAITAFAVVGFLSASNLHAYSNDSWKFEPTVGPVIGIHNWGGNQFAMDLKLGKGDMWSGLMGLAFAGANKVQIKLGVVFDYPFYFTFSKSKDFSVGPTVDVGPRFGFGNFTAIDFFNIGFGARTTYKFNDKFGVVADLAHFTMSFVGWAKGAGVNSGFIMAYDMKFGIMYMF